MSHTERASTVTPTYVPVPRMHWKPDLAEMTAMRHKGHCLKYVLVVICPSQNKTAPQLHLNHKKHNMKNFSTYALQVLRPAM